jgi:hypothetical protein
MNEITTVEAHPITTIEGALRPQQIVAQVQLVQQVLKEVMKPDMHYGAIPGCGDKVVLLKPGAEKLCFTFQLVPTFLVEEREIVRADVPPGHREYRITCRISNRAGVLIAEGIGIASTLEKKYRYRGEGAEATGREVPRDYWDEKKHGSPQKAQDILGGKGFTTKKIDNIWMIFKSTGEKQENPDIADVYNTVLKIGKKRSMVDGVITATAASDIFDQDLDEQYNFDQPEEAKPAQTKQEATSSPKVSSAARATSAAVSVSSSSSATSKPAATTSTASAPTSAPASTATDDANKAKAAQLAAQLKAVTYPDLALAVYYAFPTWAERAKGLGEVLDAVNMGFRDFKERYWEMLEELMLNAGFKKTPQKDAQGNTLKAELPSAIMTKTFIVNLLAAPEIATAAVSHDIGKDDFIPF